MPPIELAERMALLLALAFFLGLAFGYAVGFGGYAAAQRPAAILTVLALLGFAGAALYLV